MKVVVTNLSDTASLLCVDMFPNELYVAHTQTAGGGWTSIGPVSGNCLMIDQDEWPKFIKLVKAVDKERQRLKDGTA